MKIIQFFRTPETSETSAEYHREKPVSLDSIALACFLLSNCEARNLSNDVAIYTDPAGHDLLINGLGFKSEDIHLLSPRSSVDESWQHCELYNMLSIAAQQDEPFLVVSQYAFIWQLIRVNFPILVFSSKRDDYATYLHLSNLHSAWALKIENTNPIGSNIIDLSVFGGEDFNFWKSYFDKVQAYLRENRMIYQSNEAADFLLHSHLLNNHVNTTKATLNVLTKRPLRIPHVKSVAELFKLHSRQQVTMLPSNVRKYEETFRFIVQTLKVRHPTKYHQLEKKIYRTDDGLKDALDSNFLDQFKFTTLLLNLAHEQQVESLSVLEQKVSTHLLSHTVDERLKALLQDAFHFEKVKYSLNKETSECTIPSSESNESLVYSDELSRSPIVLSQYARITATKWDWRLGIEVEELFALKLVFNKTVEEANFHTLFVFDEITNKVLAYPVDELNQLVIESMNAPKTLPSIVEEISEHFDKDDITSKMHSIQEVIAYRIRDLLRLKALVTIKLSEDEQHKSFNGA